MPIIIEEEFVSFFFKMEFLLTISPILLLKKKRVTYCTIYFIHYLY